MPTALNPQVLRAAASLEKFRQTCRQDPFTFAAYVAQNQEGEPLDMAWPGHHQWYRHLNYCWPAPEDGGAGLRCMIWAPMGHGKTSGFTTPLVSWLIGNDLQRRIKVICNLDVAAAQRVDAVKQLMRTPKYRWIFPEVKPGGKWSNHEVYVQRKGTAIDPTLHARGVEVKGIGGRADVLIFDDVCDPNNSADPVQRAKILQRVDQTWMTRLEGGKGLVLWIATPWHSDDASHHLRSRAGWGTLVQAVRPVEQQCNALDTEVFLNPVSGQILPPYPNGPVWAPGQPWPNSRGVMDALTYLNPNG